MKAWLFAIPILFLPACATKPSQLEQDIAERKAKYGDHTIRVETMPPGAIIDWNNDVAGVSPCEVIIKDAYKGQWPGNGYPIQKLNCRWIDGTATVQTFSANTPAPKHVIFLHPNPAYRTSQPSSLSQR
jgi:hypothetical protein